MFRFANAEYLYLLILIPLLVAVLGYVEPAVAVLVSTLILHQPLSALGWLGAVLILGAAAASEVVE